MLFGGSTNGRVHLSLHDEGLGQLFLVLEVGNAYSCGFHGLLEFGSHVFLRDFVDGEARCNW